MLYKYLLYRVVGQSLITASIYLQPTSSFMLISRHPVYFTFCVFNNIKRAISYSLLVNSFFYYIICYVFPN